ncbi:MAG: type IV toxin-antitoxin system AbiEi family antitoxin [Mycobacterium sp.]
MVEPFLGAEAIRAGRLTRGQLRSRFRAVHPGVYVPRDAAGTLLSNTVAAWLWTSRRGVIAGRAAAALHGARWIDDSTPIELIVPHTRKRPGVIVHEEQIKSDEVCVIGGLPVSTPERTALNLARWLPRDSAVRHLDSLARATAISKEAVLGLAARYPVARHARRARAALDLMDAGSQSPRETWLRLLVIDAGYERPQTQVRVTDGVNVAFIDLGWEEHRIGLDYDGDHHRSERRTYVNDIGRYSMIDDLGWIDLRVVAEHSRAFILHRLREAFRQRGLTPPPTSANRS